MFQQSNHPYISNVIHSLLFMTSLYKEHPLFIKKMANCDSVLLNSDVVHTLNQFSVSFEDLEIHLHSLDIQWRSLNKNNVRSSPYFFTEMRNVLQNIIRANVDFLNYLNHLESFSSKKETWTIVLNHIAHEHKQLLQKCSEFSIRLTDH